jgi:HD-GYP domain-containing protein (c-di-GMP phosphodiesterase class II)
MVELNKQGLEAIIKSTAKVFKNQSLEKFGASVLVQLSDILNNDFESEIDAGYLIGMPNSRVLVMAGTKKFKNKVGKTLEESMPDNVITCYKDFFNTGGECIKDNAYTGVFRTSEGFISILYIEGFGRLTDIEQNLVRIYANNIAIGFDNVSLSREIINTQKEVILTLGEIVETRSQETAHHVTRVAESCYLLAKKCGFDEKTCEILRLAAPMHDVGKIGVPEAILNKPGKLTDKEFLIIQQHSKTGYEILNKSNRPIMKAAACVALQHHEHWDGNGYPEGLSGENIHIYGRIAAIADVFDALSHKRCYKNAWQMPEIVRLFKTEAGKHFDPELVDIFISHIGEFEEINARFPE